MSDIPFMKKHELSPDSYSCRKRIRKSLCSSEVSRSLNGRIKLKFSEFIADPSTSRLRVLESKLESFQANEDAPGFKHAPGHRVGLFPTSISSFDATSFATHPKCGDACQTFLSWFLPISGLPAPLPLSLGPYTVSFLANQCSL